jgi:hypothetical protein
MVSDCGRDPMPDIAVWALAAIQAAVIAISQSHTTNP